MEAECSPSINWQNTLLVTSGTVECLLDVEVAKQLPRYRTNWSEIFAQNDMTTENETACKQITLSDAYMSGQCQTWTNKSQK